MRETLQEMVALVTGGAFGLPAVRGGGTDLLPSGMTAQFEGSLVRHLDAAELRLAFRVVVRELFSEIRFNDEELAGRWKDTLTDLIETAQ